MKGPNGQLPKLRPDVRLYLFHGSDEGAAGDLARRLAAAMPDAERVDVEAGALKKNPGLLADEALSPSLFGDARVLRVSVGEDAAEALALLLDARQGGSPVVAVGTGLKTSGKVVKLANDHPRAVAVACYPPDAAQAERLVKDMLAEQGLRAAPGIARRLADAGGGDRAVIAQEVEKLALFLDAAPDRPRDADAAALDAIGANLDEGELAGAVDALVGGKPDALGAALTRLDAGNASPVPWLRAVQRRLLQLGDLRASVDGGETPEAAMKRARVHFREEARTAQDLRRWTPKMIAAALTRVRDAEAAAMASGTAGAVAAEHAAVALGRRVAERR